MHNQKSDMASIETFAPATISKLAYSIEEAAEVTGLSRAFIYAEWQAGRGPRKAKVGSRTLILDESLRSWLRSLEYQPVR